MNPRQFLAVAILSVAPAFGHHSFKASFDASKQITISGTISKLDFLNPHAFIYIDVKNPDGTTTNWKIETASPGGLISAGVTKAVLAPGTSITVDAFPAKDGSPRAHGLQMRLADGRQFEIRDTWDKFADKASVK